MAEKEQILEEIEAEIQKAKGDPEEFEIEVVDEPVQEAKEEANRVLVDLKKETFNEFAIEIETIISYGAKYNKIVDLINEDKTISILVLGAAPEGKGTNDLVNKFSTGLTSSIHIPLTIVPGNLSKDEIEKIT